MSDTLRSAMGAMFLVDSADSNVKAGPDPSGAVIMARMLSAVDRKGLSLATETMLGLYTQRLNNGSFAVAIRPEGRMLKSLSEVGADPDNQSARADFLRAHKIPEDVARRELAVGVELTMKHLALVLHQDGYQVHPVESHLLDGDDFVVLGEPSNAVQFPPDDELPDAIAAAGAQLQAWHESFAKQFDAPDLMAREARYILVDADADVSQTYAYYIDLNERGRFLSDVRHALTDRTIYEIRSDDEDGSVPIIEDGYMRHTDDVDGLARYLKQLKVLPETATLEPALDAEQTVERADEAVGGNLSFLIETAQAVAEAPRDALRAELDHVEAQYQASKEAPRT